MVRVRGAERQKKEKASAVSVEAFGRRSERTPVCLQQFGVFRRQSSAEKRRYVSAFAFKLRDGLGDRRASKVREFKSLNDFPAAVLRRAGNPKRSPSGMP